MSQTYICDITGVIVPSTDLAEMTVEIKNKRFNGVQVDIGFTVSVDAFAGAKETHLHPDEWPPIMAEVKQWIIDNYA
jgi:hypothetical protein